MNILKGKKEYFKGIGKIKFEGRNSDNPLAFKFYDENKMIGNQTMKEHLRFSVCYWHTFCNLGNDPFGVGTKIYPWLVSNDPITQAKEKMDAAFEFITKLGVKYYCFHDYDLITEGDNLKESAERLQLITDYAKLKQEQSGVQLLWGTSNCFSHPKFMNGAATNPDFKILAHAAFQVKNAIDTTIKLNGLNYVFWGGREGYLSLLNTDMKRELDHLAQFLHMAKDYGRSQGFKGTFFIEPKPMEPTKHQYDFDVATVIGFLRKYNLLDDFKLNIEVNHATLANHTFSHELQTASDANLLGSIDANRGDYQNGWDTDQFPVDVYELTHALMIILKQGGICTGGINFDAKTRRNSTDLADIFYAHIGGMDVFARALTAAYEVLNHSDYLKLKNLRYSSFDSENGNKFETGNMTLTELADIALKNEKFTLESGKQELFENLINQYIS